MKYKRNQRGQFKTRKQVWKLIKLTALIYLTYMYFQPALIEVVKYHTPKLALLLNLQ